MTDVVELWVVAVIATLVTMALVLRLAAPKIGDRR